MRDACRVLSTGEEGGRVGDGRGAKEQAVAKGRGR